jgi:hypothetical protein
MWLVSGLAGAMLVSAPTFVESALLEPVPPPHEANIAVTAITLSIFFIN